ncbi:MULTISPECIES: hydroxymethylglutaryl-CoA synthase [unclassified Streptomyces]|uniref:hydroxymethylglutaryl-CoA synthase family protein n=1 Tax=unclassified Streptomyces TaxID=2593676 RepID=UPI002E280476|nr:hydroxymethylglutaryl-CoA synthase [Streptomyces sp. NBC_00441]
MTGQPIEAPRGFGIEALNVYCGAAHLPVRTLLEGRGLDLSRIGHLMMETRSVSLPCEDPVTHAVNAAKPLVDALSAQDKERIELLITSSESGVDYSKSIASYVHEHLGLSRHCRVIEVKQACYAATAAVQLAVAYAASGVSPGAKALVIATDVAMVDENAHYAEPATGAGAAAMLIGDRPDVLALDIGAFGTYSYETLDSARPGPDFDIADVDRSLFAYLDCFTHAFADYRTKVPGADLGTDFAQLALHTPFAGLVKAGHRKLMREVLRAAPDEIDADFTARVTPSLTYPRIVGNLCSGSVYLALSSIIDHVPYTGELRVGLFSYGSGCASEFFSGVIGQRSRAALARMRIGERLASRTELSFADYEELLTENMRCLVPARSREVDVARYKPLLHGVIRDGGHLVLRGVEEYHRVYEWV